jgi:hypothetical protein
VLPLSVRPQRLRMPGLQLLRFPQKLQTLLLKQTQLVTVTEPLNLKRPLIQ